MTSCQRASLWPCARRNSSTPEVEGRDDHSRSGDGDTELVGRPSRVGDRVGGAEKSPAVQRRDGRSEALPCPFTRTGEAHLVNELIGRKEHETRVLVHRRPEVEVISAEVEAPDAVIKPDSAATRRGWRPGPPTQPSSGHGRRSHPGRPTRPGRHRRTPALRAIRTRFRRRPSEYRSRQASAISSNSGPRSFRPLHPTAINAALAAPMSATTIRSCSLHEPDRSICVRRLALRPCALEGSPW
jgi:hypothetical protein